MRMAKADVIRIQTRSASEDAVLQGHRVARGVASLALWVCILEKKTNPNLNNKLIRIAAVHRLQIVGEEMEIVRTPAVANQQPSDLQTGRAKLATTPVEK